MRFEKSIERDLEKSSNIFAEVLTTYFKKMKGDAKRQVKIDYIDSLVSVIGGFIAMIAIGFVAIYLGYPMALAPLGASCVLVFLMHKGPLSQPRQVIGGHFFSTTAALTVWSIIGHSLFTIGLVVVIVLMIMLITDTFHPPAAASALVAVNFELGWGFLLVIMIGALLLVAVSTFYNNIFQKRQYPQHWL
ncbi:HPP family protein [Peribacillus asahii]|uniref:HPP family protein n=1 Tax=Peribacillus asahii TaxID=228899 RepID=UPI0037F9CD09